MVALVGAAPARADFAVGMSGSTLNVQQPASEGAAAQLLIDHLSDGGSTSVRIREIAPPPGLVPGPGCQVRPDAGDVSCAPLPSAIVVTTGAGSDDVRVGGGDAPCGSAPTVVPVQVELNAGNDRLEPLLSCQPIPTGGPLDPFITGPPAFRPQFAADGGKGNDVLIGGHLSDLLNGGGGFDTVSYAARVSPVQVTLDGVGNDGEAGEADQVLAIDKVIGGTDDDEITGSTGADTLVGGPASDTLRGGAGNDLLLGDGALPNGTDVFVDGSGDDQIDSRDGIAENVSCGSGFDTVTADLEDRVEARLPFSDAGCESVTRSAVDDGPPGRILGRSVRVSRDGRVKLRLACPRRARVACQGRLRLTMAGRRRRSTLGASRYAVPLRRTRAIQLRLSRRAVARARRDKLVIAVTRERGVSKKGPRSATVSLRVRT